MPAKKYPNGLTRRQLKKANRGRNTGASVTHKATRWISDAGPVPSDLKSGVVKDSGKQKFKV